eukprot:TRINITY_DN50696_c0_g1_i1.p1 TRINITY_DN50696_c0_g1~~TRINITY_DN50696_c0_g1_i1.p1  ORF type:complete len:381 (+),score=15.53 TRINITY_DN50696_c0_g1_i1:48-1190(+)
MGYEYKVRVDIPSETVFSLTPTEWRARRGALEAYVRTLFDMESDGVWRSPLKEIEAELSRPGEHPDTTYWVEVKVSLQSWPPNGATLSALASPSKRTKSSTLQTRPKTSLNTPTVDMSSDVVAARKFINDHRTSYALPAVAQSPTRAITAPPRMDPLIERFKNGVPIDKAQERFLNSSTVGQAPIQSLFDGMDDMPFEVKKATIKALRKKTEDLAAEEKSNRSITVVQERHEAQAIFAECYNTLKRVQIDAIKNRPKQETKKKEAPKKLVITNGIRASRIIIRHEQSMPPGAISREEALLSAEGILQQLTKRLTSFSNAAKNHSDDPSAPYGGDLGELSVGDVEDEVWHALRDMSVWDLSTLFDLRAGYCIVQRTPSKYD